MSLKAKIEAVIYASEEPVTLSQLVGLLGEEAQAELDRVDSSQGSLVLEEIQAAGPPVAEADAAADVEASSDTALDEPSSVPPDEPSATGDDDGPHAEEEQPAESGQAAAAPADGNDIGNAPAADAATAARAERVRLARLRAHFRTVLDALIAEYAAGDRGLEVREIAGGFRFGTKPEYHDAVRGFVRSLKPPLKLTLQALETLAVVAYKQPVTGPEISEIRGVDSGGVLGSLIARKLITTAGRKQVIGRPILYKTTKEFLLKFGLKDLNELPSIEEFERMAGHMAEQEEIPMPDAADPTPDMDRALEQSAERLEPARDIHSSQADGEVAPADNLEGAPADKASIDGRISSLPPNYAAADEADDPSAQEAEVQREQGG
ncbi:MAG: SMC-Scp complex subunit ScpB [Acidobacteriota bacterium]|nr:SMC-Scp complex subunit ScpB [Acidobacteriota bacterium]